MPYDSEHNVCELTKLQACNYTGVDRTVESGTAVIAVVCEVGGRQPQGRIQLQRASYPPFFGA